MSEKYGIDESNFHKWKDLGYITSFEMEEGMMVNERTFTQYLNIRKVKGLDEDALAQLFKEKKLEREVTLSRLKDEVFLLKTHSRHPEIFHILIQVLSELIVDDCQRGIFQAISFGEPVSRVASRYGMTYHSIVMVYNSLVEKLSENPTRIFTLRQYATGLQKPLKLNNPMEILLIDLFPYRIWILFSRHQKMKTLYDLLAFATQYGWSEIQKIKNVGITLYNQIINHLQMKGYIIIREDNEIELTPEMQAFMKK